MALEADKHVVLEKPFTITSHEAMLLVELARLTGKVLTVYQNRRYVGDFITMKEILEKKLLGEVHSFFGHYDRYRVEARPRPGEKRPCRAVAYCTTWGPI